MISKNTMRFGRMIWPINPEDIKFTRDRKLSFHRDLYHSSLFDGGQEAGTIKVSGCFFGENADAMAEALENIMAEGKVLPLYLPGMGITQAKLKKLEQEGRSGFGKSAYSMEFLEVKISVGKPMPEIISGKSYVAAEGDSIWDVQNISGVPAEELVRLNPHIRNLNLLGEGEVLWLR